MLNDLVQKAARRAVVEARRQAVMVQTMTKAGIVRPHHPARLAQAGKGLLDWGMGFAGGIRAQALLAPDQVALIDEEGELTWSQIDERATRLADALHDRGVREGDSVAVLCRNHRYFLDVSTALAKLGVDILYLNTAFAAPQLGEVCEREKPAAIVYDEEFEKLIDTAGIEVPRYLGLTAGKVDRESAQDLIDAGTLRRRKPPERIARPVILTSGTTGTPKGAPRSEAGLDAAVALLSKLDFKAGDIVHIAAPVFHTWGWAHLNLAMLLGSTVVLRTKFDPADALRTIEEHHCTGLVVVPVMLQRILALPEDERSGDYSSLRTVAASGSALPGDLAEKWMDTFGDNLYNTYGSTEVAWATIAQPRDMREAPGTAGSPPPNTVVKIIDESGKEVPRGESGRIFVGNSMLFGGYTGGGHKEVVDGLMSTGDIGRLDENGRLFVEGRDDEMIVSGGENVFPKEVEDCIARHDAVAEVAAIGIEDDDFGKRLRAFVVLRDSSASEEEVTEQLRTHVKDNLARFKVPRDFIYLDELPRNATGKVLKRELVEWDDEASEGDLITEDEDQAPEKPDGD